jgi:L-threonylcarbamoyladenylate synthase
MTVLPFSDTAQVRAAVPRVAAHLDGGGLLAYPTETVYGLGSRPRTADLTALAALKGRPPDRPFLLLVASRAMAERCGLTFTATARALTDRFWPGPLTLILPGGEGKLPDALRGPGNGIAVRWTSHPGMVHLLAGIDAPLTSTSANLTGGRTASGVAAILETFAAPVEDGTLLVLDGGTLGDVPPSTVVDCTGAVPKLVREGALALGELRSAAGSLVR